MDFFKFLQDDLKIYLNAQQRDAVLAPERRILLEACPGSGKTTTMIVRLAYLILCKNIPSHDILTLTFSRATARDMEKRFKGLFGNIIIDPVRFSTIHSFCYQFLFYCQSRGILTVPQLIEGRDSNGKTVILRKIYYDIHGEFLSEDRVTELSNEIGFVKNKFISPSQHKSSFQGFEEIYRKYEAYKRHKNLMDFDDMLSVAFEVLRKNKNIYNRYGKFSYINVDEVQDTSLLQHKIIEEISDGENLFMVGDIDQSIYGFRGAEPDYILNLKNMFPETRVLKLEKNYRSTKSIVMVSNEIIRENQFRIDKNMCTDNETGPLPVIIYVDDQFKQVQTVMKLLSSAPYTKTAVLFRNNLSGLPVAYSMILKGQAFEIRENYSGFFEHVVLDDVFTFFKLANDFSDFESFRRVCYKMDMPVPKQSMKDIQLKAAEKGDIFAAMYSLYRHNRYIMEHVSRIRKALGKIRSSKMEKALDIIETDLRYNSFLKRNTGYIQIYSMLKYFARGLKTPDELKILLNTLKNGIEQYYTRIPDTQVSLLTFHSSKGLEFDRVIMIDLVEGILPSEKAVEELSLNNRKILEEETRLFYVGVTRAIKELFILVPRKIDGKKMTPSRFAEKVKNYKA